MNFQSTPEGFTITFPRTVYTKESIMHGIVAFSELFDADIVSDDFTVSITSQDVVVDNDLPQQERMLLHRMSQDERKKRVALEFCNYVLGCLKNA